MPGCPDSCEGRGCCGTPVSSRAVKSVGPFHQRMLAEEQLALEELRALDRGIEQLYNTIVRTHTMAAAGVLSKQDLTDRIREVKRVGVDLIGRLHAFTQNIDQATQHAEEHLVGHLPEKEGSREDS